MLEAMTYTNKINERPTKQVLNSYLLNYKYYCIIKKFVKNRYIPIINK